MRFLSIMFFLASGPAFGEAAIQLSPTLLGTPVEVVKTENYMGSCGKASVQVLGVERIVGDFFTIYGDAGRVVVRGDGRTLFLDSSNGFLSDHNGVACLSTPSGSRLLIWSNCGGSGCGDEFNFFVIDPDHASLVAPKDPSKSLCDANCASRVLQSNFPKEINQ